MPDLRVVSVAAAVLSVGTYLFRWAGPALPARLTNSPRVRDVVNDAAVLLLAGVIATTAVTQDQHFAGWARVAGVAVAGVLAWRRAPFVVVVVVSATVAALGRLAGVS